MRQLSFSLRMSLYFGALFLSAVGALALLWYLGLAWLGVTGAGEQQLQEATRLLELAAGQQRAAIRGAIEERRGDILVFAENKILSAQLRKRDGGAQRDMERVVERLQRAYPDAYTSLQVADLASGLVRLSSNAADLGRPFSDPALLARARQPGTRELVEQVAGPGGQTLAIVRQIDVPDADGYPSGVPVGVLVAYLDTALLIEGGIRADREDDRPPGNSLLYGPSGELLARFPRDAPQDQVFRPDARVASGFEGTLTVPGRDGRELLVVYRHVPLNSGQGWTLVHYRDKAQALAGLQRHTRALVAAGLLLSAMALLLIGLAARRLTAPMQLLARAARQFGEGDLAVRAPGGPGHSREVGELSDAFNGMAERIGKAHRVLEARVLERTEELASERDTAQRYLDIAGVMLMVLDRAGRIVLINRRGADILGHPEHALLGTDWFAFFPVPAQRDALRRAFDARMAGTAAAAGEKGAPVYYENRIVAGANRELVMAWHENVLRDAAGEPTGSLSSGEDITLRRQSEQALRRVNIDLERGVALRTHELAAANASLQGTLDALRHTQGELIQREKLASLGVLVAGIAHELNTPLGNSVTISSTLAAELARLHAGMSANALTKSGMNDFIHTAGEGLALLERNLERAADMVTHFKQVAVDQASAKRRRFDLAGTIREIVDTVRPQFRGTPHSIVLELAPGVEMDSFPGPLGQVLTNLLLNALIHGLADGGAGEVRLSATPAADGNVTLLVADSGAGIAHEHLSRVFDPFFTTRLGQGGSGLGLHIVFNLVTATLGGAIHVDSQAGQGTVFRIDLPCIAPTQNRAAQAAVLLADP
jgi:PAS domain S-box-containing protein